MGSELAALTRDLGFPIAVALWSLWELRQVRRARRKERQQWRDSIQELSTAIHELRKTRAARTDGGERED